MNLRVVIDGIVRQTTILIAQLSTTAGVRSPLAHVADEVFRNLALEIEAQGVGRKVAADMFGLALRTYQKKLQRLQAGQTDTDRTLWQAMIEFLQDGSKTRARIFQRFGEDGEREVAAVINDLVTSGLVYSTGRGDDTRYGLTPEADLLALSAAADDRALAPVLWITVFSGHARTETELAQQLRVELDRVQRSIESLIVDGRLRRTADGKLESSNVVIPVGANEGWEAAILDHFRAATNTIAKKVAQQGRSTTMNEVGGTTLSFSVYDGHPFEERVRTLLSTVRNELHALWSEVSDYNARHEVPRGAARVVFYFGQHTVDAETEEPVEQEMVITSSSA